MRPPSSTLPLERATLEGRIVGLEPLEARLIETVGAAVAAGS